MIRLKILSLVQVFHPDAHSHRAALSDIPQHLKSWALPELSPQCDWQDPLALLVSWM